MAIKVFKKFIALKETKDELKQPAKTQLEAWSKELDGVVTGLAKLQKDSEKDLKAGDATNLNKALDEFVF